MITKVLPIASTIEPRTFDIIWAHSSISLKYGCLIEKSDHIRPTYLIGFDNVSVWHLRTQQILHTRLKAQKVWVSILILTSCTRSTWTIAMKWPLYLMLVCCKVKICSTLNWQRLDPFNWWAANGITLLDWFLCPVQNWRSNLTKICVFCSHKSQPLGQLSVRG